MPSDSVELAITSELFYPELPGGLAQFYRYAPGLTHRGVDVHAYTPHKADQGEQKDEVVNSVTLHRLPIVGGGSHHSEREQLVSAVIQRHSGLAKPVVLQPNGATWKSTALLWKARKAGIPASFYFTMTPDSKPPGLIKGMRFAIRMRSILSPFKKLLFCSERIRSAYQEVGGLEHGRTTTLPNGVDLQKFRPAESLEAKRDLRIRLGLPPDAPIIVYAGSITPRKGVDLLLDAWTTIAREHPSAQLVIAGSLGMRPSFRNPEMATELQSFTSAVERQIAEAPRQDALHLTGDIKNIDEYYQAADIFVFPSHREGLPNAVLEALSSGLACVLCPFDGFPKEGEEFGYSGQHFVPSEHTPDSIAREVLGVLDNPEKLKLLGNKGRQWMEETQDLERSLDRWATAYRTIAGVC